MLDLVFFFKLPYRLLNAPKMLLGISEQRFGNIKIKIKASCAGYFIWFAGIIDSIKKLIPEKAKP
jgi:hypothetical protein